MINLTTFSHQAKKLENKSVTLPEARKLYQKFIKENKNLGVGMPTFKEFIINYPSYSFFNSQR